MTDGPAARLVVAVAVGGAVGALCRCALTEAFPARSVDFPWTTFAINVAGSFLLALIPVIAPVRRSPTLAAALGPGLLGGFTTLSAYSEQARALLDSGRTVVALVYLAGTVAACLVAVALARRWGAGR